MSWTNLNLNYNVGTVTNNGNIIYCYNNNNYYMSTNTCLIFTSVLSLSNITCIATNSIWNIAIVGS